MRLSFITVPQQMSLLQIKPKCDSSLSSFLSKCHCCRSYLNATQLYHPSSGNCHCYRSYLNATQLYHPSSANVTVTDHALMRLSIYHPYSANVTVTDHTSMRLSFITLTQQMSLLQIIPKCDSALSSFHSQCHCYRSHLNATQLYHPSSVNVTVADHT